jgi:hydrogenase nickel incorporation protein HypA/HybF
MHEMSLVRSLLEESQRLCAEQGGAAIESIRLELGPLSGVEPLLVESAFEQLSAELGLAGVRLDIEETALEARCRNCWAYFEVRDFRFVCPTCGARQIAITRGDGVKLVSITIGEREAVECER